MSESSAPSRQMVAELRFSSDLAGLAQVGDRSIHQYWHLLAAHFRDILLAPQRRFDDAGVAWTWREPASSRPASAVELATLRKRLSSCNESFGESAERELVKHDPASMNSRSTLGEVRAAMSGIVISLSSKSDADFAAFVARTEMGLMLHSWGASVSAKPVSPEAHQYEVSGYVIVGLEPGAGYEVAIENRKGLRMSWMITDASGGFGFPAISPGEYRIRVISDRAHFPPEGIAIKVEHSSITDLELRSSDTPKKIAEPDLDTVTELATDVRGGPSNPSRKRARFALLGLLGAIALVVGRCAWKANSHGEQTASSSAKSDHRESGKARQVAVLSPKPSARSVVLANGGASTPSSLDAKANGVGSFPKNYGAKSAEAGADARGSKNSGGALQRAEEKPASSFKGQATRGANEDGGLTSNATGASSAEGGAAETEFTSKTAALGVATISGGMASVLGGAATGGLPANANSGAPATSSAMDAEAPSAAANSAAGEGSSSDKKNASKGDFAAGNKANASAPSGANPSPLATANPSGLASPKVGADSPPGSPPPLPTPPASSASKAVDGPKKASSEPEAESSAANDAPASKELSPPSQPASLARPTARKEASRTAAIPQASLEENSPLRETSSEKTASSPEKSVATAVEVEPPKSVAGNTAPSSPAATDSVSTGNEPTSDSTASGDSEKTPSSRPAKKNASAGRHKSGTDSSAPSPDGVVEKSLQESSHEADVSSERKMGGYRLTTRASAWQLRLLGDLILPTRPMRAAEEDAVEALRTQLLKERRAQTPAALTHPNTWCGYALEWPSSAEKNLAATLPQWRCLSGDNALEVTVRAGRAEIAWPGEKTLSSATYLLSDATGHPLARFTIDPGGSASLTTENNVRSWLWIGVEGTSVERVATGTKSSNPRFEWQCLQGAAKTSAWQRDDQWRNGKGARLDLDSLAQDSSGGTITLAFVDRLSGWALVRDLEQGLVPLKKTRP